MNQYTGDLTAAILAAAKSPAGLRTSAIPGYSSHQVADLAGKMVRAGQLFRAKISHKVVRYFDSEAAAKALTTTKPSVSIRKRLSPHSAWDDVAPAKLPEDIRVIECPSPPQHRYETADAPPCFSSLRPGQYLDSKPKAWVAAVA